MQEEQRSLSSVKTLSVRRLLLDRSVRWQVLTIVVVNIGMQLSGIDAVGGKRAMTSSLFFILNMHCSVHLMQKIRAHIAVDPSWAPSLCPYITESYSTTPAE